MSTRRGAIASYLVSLPERVVRSASALAGGLLHQIGEVALPSAVRRTRLYRSLVGVALRFLIEQVGQVEGVFPGEEKLAGDFLLRRTAGNGLELLGLLTMRASPVWVLAALADLSGAGRHLLGEISLRLEQEGLLRPGRRPETMNQLLDALEAAAGQTAESINTPPLNAAELRREWASLQRAWGSVPTPSLPSLEAVWKDLVDTASGQGRGVFELSSAIALSTWVAMRTAGEVVSGEVLGHYSRTLAEIRQAGFLPWWTREFRPYLRAAAEQFSPSRLTLTERLARANHSSANPPPNRTN